MTSSARRVLGRLQGLDAVGSHGGVGRVGLHLQQGDRAVVDFAGDFCGLGLFSFSWARGSAGSENEDERGSDEAGVAHERSFWGTNWGARGAKEGQVTRNYGNIEHMDWLSQKNVRR